MGKPLFKPNGDFNGSLPDPVKVPTAAPAVDAKTVEEAKENTVTEYSYDFFLKNVPAEVVEVAHEVIEYADEIEFPNHNRRHGEEYATLTDLINEPKMFNNNCGPVSWAVVEFMEDLPENFSASSVTLEYNEGVHVAVQLTDTDTGQEYIIDYTARQYWDKLPLPLVTRRKTWERVIDNYVTLLYKDTRK